MAVSNKVKLTDRMAKWEDPELTVSYGQTNTTTYGTTFSLNVLMTRTGLLQLKI